MSRQLNAFVEIMDMASNSQQNSLIWVGGMRAKFKFASH
jgi:hypothetical protein